MYDGNPGEIDFGSIMTFLQLNVIEMFTVQYSRPFSSSSQ